MRAGGVSLWPHGSTMHELSVYVKHKLASNILLVLSGLGMLVLMPRKNPHAVALGKLGGAKGGKARAAALSSQELSEIGRKGGKAGGNARAQKLSPKRRSEIARSAARARWGRPKQGAPPDGKGAQE